MTFGCTRILPTLVALAIGSFVSFARAAADEEFTKTIRPLIEKKCLDCHGAEKQKGDLNLAAFADYASVTNAPETWHAVFERVQAFEMPPKKAPELNYGEHQTLMKWLRTLPKPTTPNCDQLASDRSANFYRGYVMSRRLNRAEYANTIRDLVGAQLDVADVLPADGGGGEGFDTSGSALFVSSIHIEKYLKAAERIVATVLPDSTRGLSKELTQARARILIAKPGLFKSGREAAREVVTAFARRAFRRPVTSDEVDRLMTMFDRASKRGDGYVPSVRLALKAVLVSPHFLFLAEPEPSEGGIHRLAAVPLANKLSYFLWSSMPDETLLALAENGQLFDTNVYRQQIHRMLADPKAKALGERFALQWLDLDRLGTEVRPDPTKFPDFDSKLSDAMRAEVVALFNHVIRNDRPLLELIDADYTFVNARLAELYGLDGVKGDLLQQVKLTDRKRGGVVGMAAVHAMTSFPLRTSPVLRGRWVLESLLGDPVPPPPPDVPTLEDSAKSVAHLPLRQQLELHRSKADCASCHDKMDPLGFGLENFDVLGRWRETDGGKEIDSRGTLPSGESYSGPDGLKQILMARKDKIMRHMAKKMTGFAFGRELNKFDDCVVDRAVEALQANGYRASVLIEQIATSFPFQHRFYPKQES